MIAHGVHHPCTCFAAGIYSLFRSVKVPFGVREFTKSKQRIRKMVDEITVRAYDREQDSHWSVPYYHAFYGSTYLHTCSPTYTQQFICSMGYIYENKVRFWIGESSIALLTGSVGDAFGFPDTCTLGVLRRGLATSCQHIEAVSSYCQRNKSAWLLEGM